MSTLVACIGLGKGTWSQVLSVIENEDWEKIIIITNKFGLEKFSSKKDMIPILIDDNMDVAQLQKELESKLRAHIGFGDVGVNLISATGKEHMALISALLRLGSGIRLIYWDGEKVKEL